MKRILYKLKISKNPIIERHRKITKIQIEKECNLLNLILPDTNDFDSSQETEIGNIISDFKEFKYRRKLARARLGS